MRRSRKIAAVAGAVGLALTATACGSDAEKSGEDSITVVITQEARGLDPIVAGVSSLTGGSQAAAIFDTLLWIDPKTGRTQPQLAEGATAEGDGRVWTLKLRPNLRFSDGNPLDAEAVTFNWERHADPANNSVQRGVVAGLKFQAVDPTTVRIELPAPNAHFDKVIAHNLAFVGSPAAIKADAKQFAQKPVGAGPYIVKSWVRDAQLELEANPSYFQKGLPKIRNVTFKPVPDQTQRLNMLKAGQAHLLTTVNYPLADAARKEGLEVTYSVKSGGFMTMFNTTSEPFDDPRARRAWALLMNPSDRNATVLKAPQQTLKTFLAEGSEFVDPGAVLPSNNRAEAQALLDQLAAEGKPLKFTYTTNASPSARQGAEYWLGQLAGVRNIEMKPEFLDGGSYIQKVQVLKNFQAAEFTIAFDDPEPVLYNFLHSTGSDNRTHWANPAVDAALDQARTTTDPAVRKAAYATVQRELAKDVPLFAYEQAFTAAIGGRGKLTDLVVFEDGIVQYDRLGLG